MDYGEDGTEERGVARVRKGGEKGEMEELLDSGT